MLKRISMTSAVIGVFPALWIAVAVTLASPASAQLQPQLRLLMPAQWTCELDLHQGDTGTLAFGRTGNTISGKTNVSRESPSGTLSFEHDISGTWSGEIIEFRRTLSPPTSHQDFKGVALAADDGKTQMAGRFAFRFSGVWSAECERAAIIAPPKTHATGALDIPQTYTADLDEGIIGASAKADIWFHAETATSRFVEPRNGATLAIVGTTSVNRDGCMAASLSSGRIPISSLPVGTYVCVLTNEGRYSQFRVNGPVGPSPGTLEIGYTTWEAVP